MKKCSRKSSTRLRNAIKTSGLWKNGWRPEYFATVQYQQKGAWSGRKGWSDNIWRVCMAKECEDKLSCLGVSSFPCVLYIYFGVYDVCLFPHFYHMLHVFGMQFDNNCLLAAHKLVAKVATYTLHDKNISKAIIKQLTMTNEWISFVCHSNQFRFSIVLAQ